MRVERYRELNGYYSVLLLVVKIFQTRENRTYLKEQGIKHKGDTLGREPV